MRVVTYAPDPLPREKPACGRCRRCHPGKQWGGDTLCQTPNCTCHEGDEMSDRVPPGQLRILTARDRHVCVWTGEDSDRLVPQHRQGGMGGRAHKHRTANLIWLDSEINGLIEADANWQAAAKAFGIKISIHADPEKLPVFFQHEHAWFMLEGDSRREIPTGEAIARMHAFYGDEFYAWMTVARESTSFRALYLRGAR